MFYRYRPLCTKEHLDWRLSELNGSQYACPLYDLNDKNEGCGGVITKPHHKGLSLSLLYSEYINLDFNTIRIKELESEISSNQSNINHIDNGINNIKCIHSIYKIISFNTEWHNQSMWAYYANNNNGIVIQYNDDIRYNLNKIQYTLKRTKSTDRNYINVLRQKHPNWIHEDEYRLITKESNIIIKPCGCIIGTEVDDTVKPIIYDECNKLGIECLEIAFSEADGTFYLYNEHSNVLYYPSNDIIQSNWSTLSSSNIINSYSSHTYDELESLEYKRSTHSDEPNIHIYKPSIFADMLLN